MGLHPGVLPGDGVVLPVGNLCRGEGKIPLRPCLFHCPAEVSHGEDYTISWQDAGMEAHVRFLLDRPEGEIYHSNLWDIRCLAIYGYPSAPFDLMAEGEETLTRNNSLENPNRWRYWEKREFPPIASPVDLRHFDSLQIFCLFQQEEFLNSNIKQCDNLQILELDMSS